MKYREPVPAALRIPPQWHWHYRKLLSCRESFFAQAAAQTKEVEQPIQPCGLDVADSANDEIDHEMALGILAREQDALDEVDAAIRRILNGTYGICENTGKPIPEVRLRAVPWTRYTKESLETLEYRQATALPSPGTPPTMRARESRWNR